MLYLVLAYPKLSNDNFEFIQNYRSVNDPLYFNMVRPHFTMVFPTPYDSEQEFISEITRLASTTKKFSFKIKCATINQDYTKEFYHEFLVPDKGYSDIIKLHDKLYSEKLSKYLCFNIDFIPHIGIWNSKNVFICKRNIDYLNNGNLSIEGDIEELDIVKYENDTITTIKKIQLI